MFDDKKNNTRIKLIQVYWDSFLVFLGFISLLFLNLTSIKLYNKD